MTHIRFQGGGVIGGPAEKVQVALEKKRREASHSRPFASFENPSLRGTENSRKLVLYVDGPDVAQAGTTYDEVHSYLDRNIQHARPGVHEHKVSGTLKPTGEPFDHYELSD